MTTRIGLDGNEACAEAQVVHVATSSETNNGVSRIKVRVCLDELSITRRYA